MIRHELEEKIMQVWNTADDLDALLHYLDEHEISAAGRLDNLMNMIIGIQSLHTQKSKMLFEEFEKVLKSNGEEEKTLEEEIEKLNKTVARYAHNAVHGHPEISSDIEGNLIVSCDPSYGEPVAGQLQGAVRGSD